MKTILTLFCCLIFSGGFCQSLTDSLILYYPLNGNTLDSSENHFNGITNATFGEGHSGNPNGALHLNGFDQYLDFPPNQAKLKPTLPVSFSFWVKFEDLDATKVYVFDTDFDQDNHSGVWMNLDGNQHMSISYGDATNNTSLYNRRTKIGSTPLEIDTWYFVIGICRGATDMDIYINCAKENGYYEGYGGDLAYTACQGSIGRIDAGVYSSPDYFKGSVDEFRYWHKALTAADIEILCPLMNTDKTPGEMEGGVSLFPNPVNDYLFIQHLPVGAARMNILNSSGGLIQSQPSCEKVDTGDFPAGIYFLVFLNDQNVIIGTEKFIKQ
jgi:hypothetical protein